MALKTLFFIRNRHEDYPRNILIPPFRGFVQKYPINTDTIPIIDDPSKRKFNKPFKKSDDGDNVVRYIQKAPKGLGKKIFEFVSVVGTSKYRKEIFETITSDDYEIRLEKEPENQFDKNAVKVMSNCKIHGDEKTFRIGYLPREIAKKLSNYENIGVTLRVLYIPTAEKSPGFRLDIWSERAKRKTKEEEKPYTNEIHIPEDRHEAMIKAEKLEKDGYINNAIKAYEKCIEQGIDVYPPYKRLCIIYRRKKEYEKELLIIEKGLSKFNNKKSISDDLKKRLERTKQLKDKK